MKIYNFFHFLKIQIFSFFCSNIPIMGFKISPSQALLLTISAKVQICLLYPLGHNPSATDDLTKICQHWWWVLSNYRTKLSDVWSEDDCLRLNWFRQWSVFTIIIVVLRVYWGKLSCSLYHSSHLIETLHTRLIFSNNWHLISISELRYWKNTLHITYSI